MQECWVGDMIQNVIARISPLPNPSQSAGLHNCLTHRFRSWGSFSSYKSRNKFKRRKKLPILFLKNCTFLLRNRLCFSSRWVFWNSEVGGACSLFHLLFHRVWALLGTPLVVHPLHVLKETFALEISLTCRIWIHWESLCLWCLLAYGIFFVVCLRAVWGWGNKYKLVWVYPFLWFAASLCPSLPQCSLVLHLWWQQHTKPFGFTEEIWYRRRKPI